jgi:hypothetical protein
VRFEDLPETWKPFAKRHLHVAHDDSPEARAARRESAELFAEEQAVWAERVHAPFERVAAMLRKRIVRSIMWQRGVPKWRALQIVRRGLSGAPLAGTAGEVAVLGAQGQRVDGASPAPDTDQDAEEAALRRNGGVRVRILMCGCEAMAPHRWECIEKGYEELARRQLAKYG